MEIEAGFIDIPACSVLSGTTSSTRFVPARFHAQRFAFKMTLKAGNIGFGCDLRQVEAVLRHADRADPLRQIVRDDPVGALDPFAGSRGILPARR